MKRVWPTIFLALFAGTVLVGTAWFLRVRPRLDPQDAFDEFKRHATSKEQQLTDPLILCGDAVVPLVIEGLADGSVGLRPWAAAFLGNRRDLAAVPVLTAVALDPTEHEHTRRSALASLRLITPETAEQVVAEVLGQARTESERVNLTPDLSACHHRTYFDALFARGD